MWSRSRSLLLKVEIQFPLNNFSLLWPIDTKLGACNQCNQNNGSIFSSLPSFIAYICHINTWLNGWKPGFVALRRFLFITTNAHLRIFWGHPEVTRHRLHRSVGVLVHSIPFLTSDRACGGTSAFRVGDEATSGSKCRADVFVRVLSPRSVQQEGGCYSAADKWSVFLYKYFYERELFLETHETVSGLVRNVPKC